MDTGLGVSRGETLRLLQNCITAENDQFLDDLIYQFKIVVSHSYLKLSVGIRYIIILPWYQLHILDHPYTTSIIIISSLYHHTWLVNTTNY